jgi:hypothetical protein
MLWLTFENIVFFKVSDFLKKLIIEKLDVLKPEGIKF